MLNRKLAGLLVAGLLLSAGAVNAEESAFPKSVDEEGNHLPSESTYADQHRGTMTDSMRAASDTSAFPESNATD